MEQYKDDFGVADNSQLETCRSGGQDLEARIQRLNSKVNEYNRLIGAR